MATKLINLKKTYEFVSNNDPDKDNPDLRSVYTLRSLDAFQVAYLQDQLMSFEQVQGGDQNAKVAMGRVALLGVRMALTNATNLLDPETEQPVHVDLKNAQLNGRSYKMASEELVMRLPGALIQELYTFITEVNGMTAADAKKSA